MENKQQIDELFKVTFENLPPQPTGAWDTPSMQVWNQIESQIKQPQVHTKTSKPNFPKVIWVGMLVGVIALAFICLFRQTPKSEPQREPSIPTEAAPQQPTPMHETLPTQSNQVEVPETPPTKVAKPTVKPQGASSKPPKAKQSYNNEQATEPLAPKNNLERNRHKESN